MPSSVDEKKLPRTRVRAGLLKRKKEDRSRRPDRIDYEPVYPYEAERRLRARADELPPLLEEIVNKIYSSDPLFKGMKIGDSLDGLRARIADAVIEAVHRAWQQLNTWDAEIQRRQRLGAINAGPFPFPTVQFEVSGRRGKGKSDRATQEGKTLADVRETLLASYVEVNSIINTIYPTDFGQSPAKTPEDAASQSRTASDVKSAIAVLRGTRAALADGARALARISELAAAAAAACLPEIDLGEKGVDLKKEYIEDCLREGFAPPGIGGGRGLAIEEAERRLKADGHLIYSAKLKSLKLWVEEQERLKDEGRFFHRCPDWGLYGADPHAKQLRADGSLDEKVNERIRRQDPGLTPELASRWMDVFLDELRHCWFDLFGAQPKLRGKAFARFAAAAYEAIGAPLPAGREWRALDRRLRELDDAPAITHRSRLASPKRWTSG
jgi:hypothetical protein